MLSVINSSLPFLAMLLALAIQELALPTESWHAFRPDLVMVTIFYWRLYRPDLCGAKTAFLIGILEDSITAVVPGLNAFTNIVIILFLGHYGARLRATDFTFLLWFLLALVFFKNVIQFGLTSPGLDSGLWFTLLVGRPLATLLTAPAIIAMLINIHRNWLEDPEDA